MGGVATIVRCWECGKRATRISPTADPSVDASPPLGCDDCFPHWPAQATADQGEADE